jgi:hypothetical protein|tara:strand:+ start:1652 stop:2083 length:432 start_codon:yes stop_codon:yes gene_type:complete
MIVFSTSALAQAFKVIPRKYEAEFTMSITDDSTNITVFYDITTGTTIGNFLTFNQAFNPVLVEGHFYDLRFFTDFNFWNTNYQLWENDNSLWNVNRTTDVTLFRDRIFCTDQTINQAEDQYYDLNLDIYKTFNATDQNQYKVF